MLNEKQEAGKWKFAGDKVMFIILLGLLLYSILATFDGSSQRTYTINAGTTRWDIAKEHIGYLLACIAGMFFVYKFVRVRVIQWFSQIAFGVSLVLLIWLYAKGGEGTVRAIHIGPIPIHVYEVVKIAMVAYMAWAMDAYKKDKLKFLNWLSKKHKKIEWMASPIFKRLFYIYAPMGIIFLLVSKGGFSSAFFITFMMLVTALIGGLPWKDVWISLGIVVTLGAGSFAIYKASDGKVMKFRWPTVEQRCSKFFHPVDPETLEPGTAEWKAYIGENTQEIGARLAIKEGGFFGKGAGKSDRKNSVPLIFSDYMFSFIVESYGFLLGALPLVLLYISLFARGMFVARNCKTTYSQAITGGLSLVISGQALWHMLINVGIMPQTGQTLPMISAGFSSIIMFSLAFAILLKISKGAYRNIEKEKQRILQESMTAQTTEQPKTD